MMCSSCSVDKAEIGWAAGIKIKADWPLPCRVFGMAFPRRVCKDYICLMERNKRYNTKVKEGSRTPTACSSVCLGLSTSPRKKRWTWQVNLSRPERPVQERKKRHWRPQKGSAALPSGSLLTSSGVIWPLYSPGTPKPGHNRTGTAPGMEK